MYDNTPEKNGVFVVVFPRDSFMTDILYFRPYQMGERADVEFYEKHSSRVHELKGILTNELHRVNYYFSGLVTILVKSSDIEEIVIFYDK